MAALMILLNIKHFILIIIVIINNFVSRHQIAGEKFPILISFEIDWCKCSPVIQYCSPNLNLNLNPNALYPLTCPLSRR